MLLELPACMPRMQIMPRLNYDYLQLAIGLGLTIIVYTPLGLK